eukprot:scaffold2136_cov242-Pinguiococcus_pyrenoidosus.AAC.22
MHDARARARQSAGGPHSYHSTRVRQRGAVGGCVCVRVDLTHARLRCCLRKWRRGCSERAKQLRH